MAGSKKMMWNAWLWFFALLNLQRGACVVSISRHYSSVGGSELDLKLQAPSAFYSLVLMNDEQNA